MKKRVGKLLRQESIEAIKLRILSKKLGMTMADMKKDMYIFSDNPTEIKMWQYPIIIKNEK